MVGRIFKLFILLVVLVNLSGCKKQKNDIIYDRKYIDEIKAARKDVAFFLTQNFVPGATVAIAKEGKILYSEGLGLASKDLESPATRSTKFRIGEISELFTAFIYQKMVEEGTLHPDSAVWHYFPDFPEKRFNLSLKHLVNQTSGIRNPRETERDWRALNTSLIKGIDIFKDDSLAVPPGIYQVPNLFNYNLLGAVMEKVSGKHFPKILEEYVTDTLKLENTLPDNPLIPIIGRSDFFDHNYISQVINATTRDMRFKTPSEGLLSNAEDLVKFGNALLYSDYLSEELKKRLFEPVMLQNNMPAQMTNGWMTLADREGRKIFGKAGNVTGGGAILIIYPEEKLVIACAANLGILSEDFPVFKIAEYFLPAVETNETKTSEDKEGDKE
ncbi:class A beta-lactamase-related serine hydrolase [Mariniphaga sediminis]|uniref:Class A beta-lactamase-related serine hydrolase n=1 Tax=Mariniphaga sediminis TaxID=1628158 RepID=A0A399CW38_9BACT|nr:serine hydrolase domain-containing protein [Mariniphaga sediminis]RIH63607.1 class A beta-lactamase-related serine hydrolase [Mariniphaga sediminis]